MIRILMCLLISSLLARAVRADETSDSTPAAQAANRFALGLYAHLAKKPGNLAFSPYSVSSALAMTYAGARGKTAEEMAQVLCFSGQERTHRGFEVIRRQLTGDKVELALANRLWAQAGDPFLPAYLDLVEKHYEAGMQPLQFGDDTETARRTINRWVEQQTSERIRDLIQPGVLTPATALVLTNALYFKGRWAKAFPENATRDAPFHLSPRDKVSVPTMYRHGRIRFAKWPGLQLAELAYEGGRYTIVVLVPEAVDGLPELEERLDPQLLRRWLQSLTAGGAKLYLPRFKITKAFRFAETLQAMGVREAFTARADFSGMNGRGGIFISAVEHKAFVAVDENGTEAAAATAVVMKRGGGPRVDAVIRADRPFLFLIRDRQTECILFLGRVADPRG
ncbi:MAG: serpin family protein [Planctomycetota bacterium]|jgi:serpin B